MKFEGEKLMLIYFLNLIFYFDIKMSETVGEFVDLLNFENDYEILNEYPYTIRRKRNNYEVKESVTNNGYIRIYLNGKDY